MHRYFARHLSMLLVAVLLVTAAGISTPAAPARAASISVSNETDLIDAINTANTNATNDTIILTGNITLTAVNNTSSNGPNGLPVIGSDSGHTLTIDGGGFTITRDGNSAEFRILEVASGANLTVNDLTITGGKCNGCSGGGIYNNGTFTVSNASFSNNEAINVGGIGNGGSGGAIYNRGVLTVTSSLISNNTVSASGNNSLNLASGAGISNDALGNLTVTDSTFSNNLAWGSTDGNGNNAQISGGGIASFNQATLTVSNSTFVGNSVEVTALNSAFGTAAGGGLSAGGIAKITNSTFHANIAKATLPGSASVNAFGGGIINNGTYDTMTVANTTISDNAAIVDQQTAFGFFAKKGGGIYNSSNYSTLYLYNTIIANSTDGGDCVNDYVIGGENNNLIEDSTDNCGLVTGTNGDITGLDPVLGSLTDNGGSTQTMALQPASPAIDAGDNTICADPTTVNNLDQRGITRPQGTTCDIGAFEAEQVQAGPNFVVNTNADTDDGYCTETDCTLREAINAANTNADASEITFAGNYTITLAGSQLPDITTEITITGNGSNNTIVQASENNPVTNLPAPATHAYRVFYVAASGNLNLDGMTVRHGNCFSGGCGPITHDAVGGGILSLGSLNVQNSVITANKAGNGGGIEIGLSGIAADISNSTISNNTAYNGAGVSNEGILTVRSSAFSGNDATNGRGGAVFSRDDLSVENSTFSGNVAKWNGGAIYNSGSATIYNSTISSNSTYASGLTDPEIYSGDGAGGGIYNSSTLTLVNSTLAGNYATGLGGGISGWGGTANLMNVTIAQDVYIRYGAFNVANSIMNNCAIVPSNVTLGINTNNLTKWGNCSSTFSGDPLLAPLGNYGGSTQTMALLPGSPAIDAGDSTTCADAGTVNNLDQRGTARPQGAACDIGAYENDTPYLSLSATSHDFGDQLVGTGSTAYTITATNTGGAPLVFSPFAISGEFNLSNNTCYLAPLAFGRTCTFDVTFSPLSLGPLTGSVSILSNSATTPDSVDLSGTGVSIPTTGTNLLLKPDFGGSYVFPYPWRPQGITRPYTAALDCNLFISPACSVKLTGVRNTLKSLTQTINRTGLSGDTYQFGLSSRAQQVPASGGQYKVTVLFYNKLGKLVGTSNLQFTRGTHDWETMSAYYTVPADYSRIRFRFVYQNTSGTTWFDEAFLIQQP